MKSWSDNKVDGAYTVSCKCYGIWNVTLVVMGHVYNFDRHKYNLKDKRCALGDEI